VRAGEPAELQGEEGDPGRGGCEGGALIRLRAGERLCVRRPAAAGRIRNWGLEVRKGRCVWRGSDCSRLIVRGSSVVLSYHNTPRDVNL
jgi:hypothetical protein